jgi:hypothetical protein
VCAPLYVLGGIMTWLIEVGRADFTAIHARSPEPPAIYPYPEGMGDTGDVMTGVKQHKRVILKIAMPLPLPF